MDDARRGEREGEKKKCKDARAAADKTRVMIGTQADSCKGRTIRAG